MGVRIYLIAVSFALVAAPGLAAEDVSRCATIAGTARYAALGYDHIVEVDNQCSRTVLCQVWTDVDPEPRLPLEVAAGSKASVKTRVGSPSRVFQAQGQCKFQ